MSAKRVLVTRPEPGASKTAERLKNMGYEPVILPLSKTIALDFSLDHLMPNALIATSAAAFIHLPKHMIAKIINLPLYCVGERTAEAAKQKGLLKIAHIAPNVANLVEKLNLLPKTEFLYLAGRVRYNDLEQQLSQQQHSLKIVDVYDTLTINSYDEQKLTLLDKMDAILLYSGVSARALVQIAERLNADTILFCLSLRIANEIPCTIKNVPIIAYEPHEEAILQGLETVL